MYRKETIQPYIPTPGTLSSKDDEDMNFNHVRQIDEHPPTEDRPAADGGLYGVVRWPTCELTPTSSCCLLNLTHPSFG